jgi:hypothetical protein
MIVGSQFDLRPSRFAENPANAEGGELFTDLRAGKDRVIRETC